MTRFHLNVSANGVAVDNAAAREAFDTFLKTINDLGPERITVSGSFTSEPEQLGAVNVSALPGQAEPKAQQAP